MTCRTEQLRHAIAVRPIHLACVSNEAISFTARHLGDLYTPAAGLAPANTAWPPCLTEFDFIEEHAPTRRQFQATRAYQNPRSAWWCHMCRARIKQSDRVAFSPLRS